MRYELRTVCPCGWSLELPLGSDWAARKHYPVCPDCGSDCYNREVQTGRMERLPRVKWWHIRKWEWVQSPPVVIGDTENE